MTNKKNPLKSFVFDNSTMMTPAPNGAAVVLGVNYDHKEDAKREIGAQFDPNTYMWFHNPEASWNRALDPAAVVKRINDWSWFIGYAYLSTTPDKSVRYPLPVSRFTWRNNLITSDFCNDPANKHKFKTYSWIDPNASLPVVDMIVLDLINGSKTVFVVWYDDSTDLAAGAVRAVKFVREVSVEEGRRLWDTCASANATHSEQQGLPSNMVRFIEDCEVQAGVSAISVVTAMKKNLSMTVHWSSSSPAPKQQVPSLAAMFPTVQYSKTVQHKTPVHSNTNYAINA